MSALTDTDAPTPMPPTEAWETYAACRGAGVDFHPGDRAGVALCRALCATCPVLSNCTDFALHRLPYLAPGVWGGMTWRQRKVARSNTGVAA